MRPARLQESDGDLHSVERRPGRPAAGLHSCAAERAAAGRADPDPAQRSADLGPPGLRLTLGPEFGAEAGAAAGDGAETETEARD